MKWEYSSLGRPQGLEILHRRQRRVPTGGSRPSRPGTCRNSLTVCWAADQAAINQSGCSIRVFERVQWTPGPTWASIEGGLYLGPQAPPGLWISMNRFKSELLPTEEEGWGGWSPACGDGPHGFRTSLTGPIRHGLKPVTSSSEPRPGEAVKPTRGDEGGHQDTTGASYYWLTSCPGRFPLLAFPEIKIPAPPTPSDPTPGRCGRSGPCLRAC